MMRSVIKKALTGLLTREARLALALHHPKVIAITGNLGKTSAKDAIFAAVSPRYRARKSTKSFNSDIGVPLSILGCGNPWSNPLRWIWTLVRGLFAALDPRFPALLVLEVGADQPGDISSVALWLKPDIAVFTGMQKVPVHVENFPSRDALVREKRSLFEHLREGGVILANADGGMEEVLAGIATHPVTFGFKAGCDFAASQFGIEKAEGLPRGVRAHVAHGSETVELSILGALGKPRIYAALAALASADALDIPLADAARSLAAWEPPAGRMRIIAGKNASVILDDSYNASPEATRSALDTLAEAGTKRRIAMLGDMLELGSFSQSAHLAIGEQAARCCDVLVTVGERARDIAEAARTAGIVAENVREYGHSESGRAGEDTARGLLAGDVVLVKGSQGVRMERAVQALMADPGDAGALLVRQDREWSRR